MPSAYPPSSFDVVKGSLALHLHLMAALRNHVGAIITDAKGQQIKAGTTVTDAMFGDGIARGTIPQEKGDVASISSSTGLGRMRPTSQKSRSACHLTVTFGMRVVCCAAIFGRRV